MADGAPVPVSADDGATIANADQRSETIGELGAVAKLDVPSAGSYVVSASGAAATRGSSSLEFGTNAGLQRSQSAGACLRDYSSPRSWSP